MTEGTRILGGIAQGVGKTADQLLPLLYDQLRRLAANKMANELPGQTLQPTTGCGCLTFVATNIAGQSGTTTYTDTNATGAGPFFYRAGVICP